ncbi:MAG: ribosome maturation factor RimM [Cyclobacteriaceae bacterium]|jgi:16S rRNA processing protein RimM|nr:ribosome maturation factor RimM [Cyclobacteriaceae bacterium]
MSHSEYFLIGKVTRPHGLKGAVTISLRSEAPDPASLDVVYLEQSGSFVPYFVDSVSLKGSRAYVKFQDVDTHESAALVSGLNVFLPLSERPAAGERGFYSDEIAGFSVFTAEGTLLGTVREVADAGRGRLVVVEQGDREVLIPVIGPFIQSVDSKKKTILVELPDGFLDLNT